MSPFIEQMDWSAFALECGHYDQSHFIRDLRQFSGLTPSAYHDMRGSMEAVPKTGAGSNLSNTWLSDDDNLGVMRLLITTPTGNIGSRVLRDLAELGTTSCASSCEIMENSRSPSGDPSRSLKAVTMTRIRSPKHWKAWTPCSGANPTASSLRIITAFTDALRPRGTKRFAGTHAARCCAFRNRRRFRRQSGTDNGSSRNGGHSGAIGRARSLSALRLIL